jgi:hypothetical protein
MDDFRPPEKLSFEGDVAQEWKKWRQMFELYMDAKEATGKTDKVKIGMLLSAMGPDGVERYNNFTWVEEPADAKEDKNVYNDVIKKFETELGGVKRTVFNRYKFWDYQRAEKQPFDDYLTHLKTQAKKCDFQEVDNMIRDKIIFSTSDKGLKERLLREQNIDLVRTVDICRASEVAKRELSTMMPGKEEKNVDAVTSRGSQARVRQAKPVGPSSGRPSSSSQTNNYGQAQQKSHGDEAERACSRCGRFHAPNRCPAFGKTCHKCGGPNHFSYRCRARVRDVSELGAVGGEGGPDNLSDEFFIGALECLRVESLFSPKETAWFEPIRVCSSQIKMKIDSGAETNTIPAKTWKRIKNTPKLCPSGVTLKALGGSIIEHEGMAQVTLSVKDRSVNTEVFITKQKTVPILGLKTCIDLGLLKPGHNASREVNSIDHVSKTNRSLDKEPITMASLKENYSDVFAGLGKFPGKYKIQVQNDAQPVIQHPRRISHKLYEPLREKLKELEGRGVITPVDKPTEWVHNLVITEKKDSSLRVCLDPKELNPYIKREHFQVPTFDDIVGKLGGARLFTILDQKDAYWQVELADESSDLCTFNTPFGRYKFLRMPFGICSAAEVQQKKTFQVFGDIKGVFIVADDMLIASKNEDEHDYILKQVLAKAREHGIKFNLKKAQLKKTEVVYMGVQLSSDGVKPDQEKVKAIIEMPNPTDKSGVRRLIGMLNFLSSFIPNKSSIIAPLRSLLKDDVPWHWEAEHEEAINKIKTILSSQPSLRFYDPKLPVTIQADSSSTGLGACLMQNAQPVAYASRSLTDCEVRYAQIEKELLAILFAAEKFHHFIYGMDVEVQSDHRALEKFHHFIYGMDVEVQSDHRALESIFKKHLHKASPRIQLMLLRLMRYKLAVK